MFLLLGIIITTILLLVLAFEKKEPESHIDYENWCNGNKVYKCSDCKFEIDRDYNGARNIYLKHMK